MSYAGNEKKYIILLPHILVSLQTFFNLDLDLQKTYFRSTECPKIYRKSVLHLLNHTANIYLSRCSKDLW